MIWEFEETLSNRLLLWAALSVAVGGLLLLGTDPFWRAVGLQAVIWGGIDAAIALFGRRNARRGRKSAEGAQSSAASDVGSREANRLRRLLWINTGLDVFYIAGGLALAFTLGRDSRTFAGTGWGIVLQGAFLFLFDLLHARVVPSAGSGCCGPTALPTRRLSPQR